MARSRTPALPHRALGPARRRAAALLAALVLLPLAACDDGGTADPSPTPTALSTLRDPLADLDRALWEVTDAPSMMAIPVDAGDVDKAAWAAAGVDDARIRETRQRIADFVVNSYMQPEAYRDTDDAGDRELALSKAPIPRVTQHIGEFWDAGDRQFAATEFAPQFRSIGRPRGVAHWYLVERDGERRVELGITIAYSLLDTETGTTGFFAERIAVSLVPDLANGEPTDAGMVRMLLAGTDTCGTTEAGGIIVPAIGSDDTSQSVQHETRRKVIDDPHLEPADLVAEDTGPMQFDPTTVLPACGY